MIKVSARIHIFGAGRNENNFCIEMEGAQLGIYFRDEKYHKNLSGYYRK
jgi:hypothetical protein